jgi:hypothetical protein
VRGVGVSVGECEHATTKTHTHFVIMIRRVCFPRL